MGRSIETFKSRCKTERFVILLLPISKGAEGLTLVEANMVRRKEKRCKRNNNSTKQLGVFVGACLSSSSGTAGRCPHSSHRPAAQPFVCLSVCCARHSGAANCGDCRPRKTRRKGARSPDERGLFPSCFMIFFSSFFCFMC
jgi:hypothetical protein